MSTLLVTAYINTKRAKEMLFVKLIPELCNQIIKCEIFVGHLFCLAIELYPKFLNLFVCNLELAQSMENRSQHVNSIKSQHISFIY